MMDPFDPFNFFPYLDTGLPFEALPQEEPEPPAPAPPPLPPKTVFEKVIEDIHTAPLEGWEWNCNFGSFNKSVLYYVFSHKKLPYRLHGPLHDSGSITIMELEGDAFDKDQTVILKDELLKLLLRIKELTAVEKAKKDKAILKRMFPDCKV